MAVLLAGVVAFSDRAEAQPEPRDGTAAYEELAGPGACSFPSEPSEQVHLGVSTEEYAAASACGGYLAVTGPAGVVLVQVTDHCTRCPAGLLDLSRPAFEQIADLGAGRVPVRYQPVRNPPLDQSISVRVKDGSTSGWAQFQVLDHGNPLAQVELADPSGGWRQLPRSADNFWTAASPGPGDAPHRLRITDIYGQTVTVTGIALDPGVQPTDARLYPPPTTPPTTSPPTTAPSTTSTTVPAGAEVFGSTSTTSGETASGEVRPRPSSGPRRGSGRGFDGVVPIFVLLAGGLILARFVTWRRRRHPTPPDLPRWGSNTTGL